MKNLEITVSNWLSRAHGDVVERVTLAQIELTSGGRSLTLLEDRLAHANRRFANLSAYDLAFWFASNWWRLCWEPERPGADWRMAHSMAAIGNGYVWPNVTLQSDGEQLLVQARPTNGDVCEPIRYLEQHDVCIPVGEFEAAMEIFVDSVLRRLANCMIEETALHQLWCELGGERCDPDLASMRKLEALLGFDAGAAPDSLVDELVENARVNGRAAIDEVAAEFGRDSPAVLKWVDDSFGLHGTPLESAGVKELDKRRPAWDSAPQPWQRGEAAARQARAMWGLNEEPVSSDKLVGLLGADPSLLTGVGAVGMPMAAARWGTCQKTTWRVVLRSTWKEGRRFELGRLIADALVAPEGELLMPATHAKTSRQKFQRAFAQEFLCPFGALMEQLGSLTPDDDEIEGAARYFEVSPLLVRSKLANRGLLPHF